MNRANVQGLSGTAKMESGCEVTKSKPDIAKFVFQKPLSGSDITKSKSDITKSVSDITMSELQIPLSKVEFALKTVKRPFFLQDRLASVQKETAWDGNGRFGEHTRPACGFQRPRWKHWGWWPSARSSTRASNPTAPKAFGAVLPIPNLAAARPRLAVVNEGGRPNRRSAAIVA